MSLKSLDVPRDVKDKSVRDAFVQARDALNQHAQLLEFFDVHTAPLSENNSVIFATISADQNDYAPAGWSGARWVFLNVTTACNINGFDANATQAYKTIVHVGANETPLGLMDQKLSSSAANRLVLPYPNDVYMLKNWTQDVWYDTAVSRWRLV